MRDLLEKATARPWVFEMVDGGRDVDGAPYEVTAILTPPSGAPDDDGDVIAGAHCNPTEADAALIVAAVNSYEALLDVVDAVRKRCDDAHPRWAPELRAALARYDALRALDEVT